MSNFFAQYPVPSCYRGPTWQLVPWGGGQFHKEMRSELPVNLTSFSAKVVHVRSILYIYYCQQSCRTCTTRNIHVITRGLYHLRNSIDFGMYRDNPNQQDWFCLVRKTFLYRISERLKKLGILGSKRKNKAGTERVNCTAKCDVTRMKITRVVPTSHLTMNLSALWKTHPYLDDAALDHCLDGSWCTLHCSLLDVPFSTQNWPFLMRIRLFSREVSLSY